MLSKFFQAQRYSPVKSDWTTNAKQNLEEFGITTNIEEIVKMLKTKFKNLIKKKSHDYEFKRLMEIKSRKSKLKDIRYNELKIQDYLLLEIMNASQAKAIFKFRVRMAPFGENYRGGSPTVLCPFCKLHPDGQPKSFKCKKIQRIINVEGNYEDIFGWSFPTYLVKTVQNIYNFREEYRKLS